MNDYKNAFSNNPEIDIDESKYSGDVLDKYEKEYRRLPTHGAIQPHIHTSGLYTHMQIY